MSSPRIEGVAAVAVVGMPDEKWGEAVTAVVVPGKMSTSTLTNSSPSSRIGKGRTTRRSPSKSSTRSR